MAFFPIAANTDDRSAKGLTPLILKNCYLEPQAEGSGKRSTYVIVPTPGMTLRVQPSSGQNIRGAFSRAGVQDGLLFIVAGSTLYSIDTSWTATACGTILGAGRVLMDALGANLILLGSGNLYQWNGTTLTQIVDPDFPANAYTLSSLADRIVTSEQGSDTFDWSSVGDATAWPATGFAASARYPDEIRAQAEIGGDLFHFGAATTQPWRAVGGVDSEAFDVLGSIIINRGIVGRDAWARMDSYAMFVGDDRVLYELNGYVPQRVVNRALETALESFSETDIATVQCYSYLNGSHSTLIARLPDGKAYAFDALTRKFHQRTALGSDFNLVHYARFNGYHVVASDQGDGVYTWDSNVYSDAGTSIERVAMVHVPLGEKMPISNITLDIKAFGQPLSGQGSEPKAYVTFYRDGGSLDSLQQIGVEREVSLGTAGKYNVRPTLYRLGIANAADGFLVKIRITDPIGYALTGIWVNELPV